MRNWKDRQEENWNFENLRVSVEMAHDNDIRHLNEGN